MSGSTCWVDLLPKRTISICKSRVDLTSRAAFASFLKVFFVAAAGRIFRRYSLLIHSMGQRERERTAKRVSMRGTRYGNCHFIPLCKARNRVCRIK